MDLLKRMTVFLVVTLVLGTAACSKTSSDAAITGRVKAAISKAPELKGTKVSVSTTEKVVHLEGTVRSRAERAMLISVARKVEGVKAVKAEVAVTPPQNAGTKPQQKRVVQASAKREPRAQLRAAPPGAGVPPER